MDLTEGQTRMVDTPEGTPLTAASLTLENMTVTAVGEPPSPCDRGGTAVAILPWTAQRDEPPVNSPHDQWEAVIAVQVAMGEPGDGPLDEIYAMIHDWGPDPSLCVIDSQVAEVQQSGVTVTGRGDDRQVQREARIMLAVKYRTAAGRLTA